MKQVCLCVMSKAEGSDTSAIVTACKVLPHNWRGVLFITECMVILLSPLQVTVVSYL